MCLACIHSFQKKGEQKIHPLMLFSVEGKRVRQEKSNKKRRKNTVYSCPVLYKKNQIKCVSVHKNNQMKKKPPPFLDHLLSLSVFCHLSIDRDKTYHTAPLLGNYVNFVVVTMNVSSGIHCIYCLGFLFWYPGWGQFRTGVRVRGTSLTRGGGFFFFFFFLPSSVPPREGT